MRLLELGRNGDISLTKDLIGDVPSYAILSHTWGEDNDEVTFKDLIGGSGKTKSGYNKILFCANQAKIDGLQYVWIDTCCIDKANNTELSEAIISMFRWYHHAAKCYVYLTDVSTTSQDLAAHFWDPAFRKSKWFTRGWTLQELIAPSVVEFFSTEGQLLGNKRLLERQICEITGIAVKALRGHALSDFSITERLSWAKSRETKREEDKAYSLLGIFSVIMLPMYGEGVSHAFQRLHEMIDKRSSSAQSKHQIPYATEAPFNAYQRQHDPCCLLDTRVDLLRDIYTWADGMGDQCIFWLNGLAGTGKSTIARTVARRYFDKNSLGASFFFSKGGGDVGHAGKFVTSIASQLANSIPSLDQYIQDAIKDHRDIASQSLRDQWYQLILNPLSKLEGCMLPYLIVVDALDECDNDDNIQTILHLAAEIRRSERVRLRIFLTSRPEISIRHGFQELSDTEHQDFILHNISSSIVDQDIRTFLEHCFKLIAQEGSLSAGWPGQQIVECLIQRANGLFIWAATACLFIREGKIFAAKRLDKILEQSSTSINAPERSLNEIYTTVLRNCFPPNFSDEEAEEMLSALKCLLGSIVTLLSPLSTESLSKLLGTSKAEVHRTLEDLHAILDIPKDPTHAVHLHHPSLRDFLYKDTRSVEFWVEEKQAHQILADSCIRLMSTSLKQDICNVDDPGMLVVDIESSRVKRNLSPEVQYACRYWIEHVQRSGAQLLDDGPLHCFLQEHLLHWFEALAWMGIVSEGVHAIASLETFSSLSDCPGLSSYLYDAKRFILYSRPAIEQAPLQTYSSALIFAPTTSIVREQFKRCIPRYIRSLPSVEEKWTALLQTLGGHSSVVCHVSFSPDGKTLASASMDKTVKVWNAGSGALLQTLEGHSGYVNAVSFSPDGKTLVSASDDKTVTLWDTGSGVLLQTLKAHSGKVDTVFFSPDGKMLASASGERQNKMIDFMSGDKMVKLWDARSGALLQTLEDYSGYGIKTVSFSPDSKTLALVSGDTVQLWGTELGILLQTLKGRSGDVNAIFFSPDSRTLASVSRDKTVKIWATRAGTLLQTLEGHSDYILTVSFSPDGKALASGSVDNTVKLWDAGSGALLQTLKGHSQSTSTVVFSPNSSMLASLSYDRTVKLWDAESGTLLQTLEGYMPAVFAISFSPDSKILASASWDKVKLWDARSGALLQKLEAYSGNVNPISFSPDYKIIAAVSRNKTIMLWDARSGAVLHMLEGHSLYIHQLSFSFDSKMLLSISTDNTVKFWDTRSGVLLQTLEGRTPPIQKASFSPDGKILASVHFESIPFQSAESKTIESMLKIWDIGSGAILQTIGGLSGYINVLSFSRDSKTLASADNNEIMLWDTESGILLKTLESFSHSVSALSFSPDGKILASTYLDNTIRLWNNGLGTLQRILKGHLSYAYIVSFSLDGKTLASASEDGTVKLWNAGSGALLQTFDVDAVVQSLSFSDDGTSLQTNRGSLPISISPTKSATVLQTELLSSVFVTDEWVKRGTKRILWIPYDRRSHYATVHNDIIWFACKPGRVISMELA